MTLWGIFLSSADNGAGAVSMTGRATEMFEYKKIQITVRLPDDIAEQALKVEQDDPDFLSRVVLYGLTRRSIYHQLRDRSQSR